MNAGRRHNAWKGEGVSGRKKARYVVRRMLLLRPMPRRKACRAIEERERTPLCAREASVCRFDWGGRWEA